MICVLLIQQSECPKGNLVQVAIFDVVFDHIGMFDIFNLMLPLLLTTHLEGILAHLDGANITKLPNKNSRLNQDMAIRNIIL